MVEFVRLALDAGADMDAVFSGGRGERALHVAARRGLTDVVAELVARGADPNVRDLAGRR
jgi:ankyrin repeat protein